MAGIRWWTKGGGRGYRGMSIFRPDPSRRIRQRVYGGAKTDESFSPAVSQREETAKGTRRSFLLSLSPYIFGTYGLPTAERINLPVDKTARRRTQTVYMLRGPCN